MFGLALFASGCAHHAASEGPIRLDVRRGTLVPTPQSRTISPEAASYFSETVTTTQLSLAAVLARLGVTCRWWLYPNGASEGNEASLGAAGLEPGMWGADALCQTDTGADLSLSMRLSGRMPGQPTVQGSDPSGVHGSTPGFCHARDRLQVSRTGATAGSVNAGGSVVFVRPDWMEVTVMMLHPTRCEESMAEAKRLVGSLDRSALVASLDGIPSPPALAQPLASQSQAAPLTPEVHERIQREVWQRILEQGATHAYVVVEQTVPRSIDLTAATRNWPDVDPSAVRDFNLRNASPRPFPRDFLSQRLRVVSPEMLHEVFERDGWRAFYAQYPETHGLVILSAAGVSDDGRTAIVYEEHSEGPLAGAGELLVLRHEAHGWVIVSTDEVWVS